MSVSSLKKNLRAELQLKLDQLSFGDLVVKSNNLVESFQSNFVHLANFSAFSAKNIVSFYPFGNEPQINIESEARNEPYQVAYVRITSWEQRLMVAAQARRDQPGEWEEFEVSSTSKIFQPTANRPILRADEVAAILVPALGFSTKGDRLGRGAGFYDRFLKNFPEALRVGIAFEDQIMDRVPTDLWDEGVDVILTDRGIREVIETKLLGQWKSQGKVKGRSTKA